MGYIYAKGGLVCDQCGQPSARKRKCLHQVTSAAVFGTRQTLPFCTPPALCSACFAKAGGGRGLHKACEAKATADQAREDAAQAALEAGEMFAVVAWGYGEKGLPPGTAGVVFRNGKDTTPVIIDSAAYRAVQHVTRYVPLSAFPDAKPWPDCPEQATKELRGHDNAR
jgi:hypothetical protein